MEDQTTKVETIPVTEIESWLKEHIQPYQQRIQRLEENEKNKDAQIHCLQLALEQLKVNFSAIKSEQSHGSQTKIATNGRPTTSVGVNGNKRPTTANPGLSHTDEKKPTTTRPNQLNVKPAETKPAHVKPETKPTEAKPVTVKPETKPTATKPIKATVKETKEGDDHEKKSDGSEKKVISHPVRPSTAIKKDDKKDEKKEEKKEEKKPITKPIVSTPKAAIKKDNTKEDVKDHKKDPAPLSKDVKDAQKHKPEDKKVVPNTTGSRISTTAAHKPATTGLKAKDNKDTATKDNQKSAEKKAHDDKKEQKHEEVKVQSDIEKKTEEEQPHQDKQEDISAVEAEVNKDDLLLAHDKEGETEQTEEHTKQQEQKTAEEEDDELI